MMTNKRSAEKTVRDIRRATRRHYSAEEKIRIVLEGLLNQDAIGPTWFDNVQSGCTKILIQQNSY